MKRRDLISHIQAHGCVPVREGGSHSIWLNPQLGRKEAIPRHGEIKKYLARSICRNLGVPVPPGNYTIYYQLDPAQHGPAAGGETSLSSALPLMA